MLFFYQIIEKMEIATYQKISLFLNQQAIV